MIRMASIPRARSFGRTGAVSLITCETVPIETPARSAICRIVTVAVMACRVEARAAGGDSQRYGTMPTRSLRVYYAPESDSPRAVHTGGHRQQLSVLAQLIGLREVPDRALRLIVAAAAKNGTSCVIVNKLFRPLPYISHHVHHAERTSSRWMSIDWIGTSHGAGLVGKRNSAVIPLVPPWIEASVSALGCVLPLPLMRQAFSSPTRVCPRIFLRDPCDWFVFPARRIASVLPIAEKIQVVSGMIVGGVNEFLEFGIRNRVLVDIERSHVHEVLVKATRRVLPRILDIDADIVVSLNLDSGNLEEKICLRDLHHARRRTARSLRRLDRNDLLRQDFPFVRVAGQRRGRQYFHFRHQVQRPLVRCGIGRQDGSISLCFDRKGKDTPSPRLTLRLEFHSMVQIEVGKIVFACDLDLVAIDVVFVPVYDRPKCLLA